MDNINYSDLGYKISLLKYAPLFSSLSRSHLKLVAQKLEFIEFKKDEIIYRENDSADAFYLIISGRVRAFTFGPDGREKTFTYLHKGNYFGEISLLTTGVHSATIKVENDCLLLKMQKSDFGQILKKIPFLAVELSRILSLRLKDRDHKLKSPSEGTVISVYSAISQVGKSMLAVNLAASLIQETKKKVLLLDFNPGEEGIEAMLQFTSPVPKCVLKAEEFLISSGIENNICRHSLGFNILRIPHYSNSPIPKDLIASLLSQLTNRFRYIIIDLPVTFDEVIIKSLFQSDLIYLVTDYSQDGFEQLKLLWQKVNSEIKNISQKIRIIINEVSRLDLPASMQEKLSEAYHIYATLPFTPLIESYTKAKALPFVITNPQAVYSKAIRRIAREIGEVRVGLALSSGAAFGLAHIGVLKVLEREKIPVDVIAGSSIGAMIASFWAAGKSAKEMEDIALEYTKTFRLISLIDIAPIPHLGFIKGRKVFKFLKSILKNKTFYDTHLPLKIVSSNLNTHQIAVLEEGNLAEAVRASLSVPGIFQPVRRDGLFLIDGGVLEPVPVKVLSDSGLNKIIAVNVLPSPELVLKRYLEIKEAQARLKHIVAQRDQITRLFFYLKQKISRWFSPNIFDVIVQSMQAMEYELAKDACRYADITITPVIDTLDWMDFKDAKRLIRRGEEATEKLLPQIKKLVSE